MKYYELSDAIFLVLLFIFVFVAAALMAQGAMQADVFLAFIIIAGIYAFVKPIAVLIYQKEVIEKNKGKTAYELWNEIKKQISDARENLKLDTISLPEDYVPHNMLTIDTLNLFLAEINREEMRRKTGDDSYSEYPYAYNTIIFDLRNGVVKSQRRGERIVETVKFINRNLHFFAVEKKETILPERIREIVFGRSEATTVETPEEQEVKK